MEGEERTDGGERRDGLPSSVYHYDAVLLLHEAFLLFYLFMVLHGYFYHSSLWHHLNSIDFVGELKNFEELLSTSGSV